MHRLILCAERITRSFKQSLKILKYLKHIVTGHRKWGSICPSHPYLFPPCSSLFYPLLLIPLEIGPANPARIWGCKLPQRGPRRSGPRPKTPFFIHFPAQNASDCNNFALFFIYEKPMHGWCESVGHIISSLQKVGDNIAPSAPSRLALLLDICYL